MPAGVADEDESLVRLTTHITKFSRRHRQAENPCAPSPEQTQDLYDRHTTFGFVRAYALSDYRTPPRLRVLAPSMALISSTWAGGGYLSRALYGLGAASVRESDVSTQMVRAAEERMHKMAIESSTKPETFGSGDHLEQFDRAIAIFLSTILT